MQSVYISEWHMKKLVEHLSQLLDSCFRVVPTLQNSGVKVFSQWHSLDARFYFLNKDVIQVELSEGWNELNKRSLITAILRTFRWEHTTVRRRCCWWPWRKVDKTLHFTI